MRHGWVVGAQALLVTGHAWASTGAAPWAQPALTWQDSYLATYAPIILGALLVGLFVAQRMYGDQEGLLSRLANWGVVAAIVMNAPAVVAFWGGGQVPTGAAAATVEAILPVVAAGVPAWLLGVPLP